MSRFKRQLMGEAEVKMDLSGSEVITGSQGGLLLMGSGSDGTAQFLRVNANGELITNASGTTDTNQGSAGTQNEAWFVRISDGTQVLGTGSSAPLFVSGTVALEGGEITVGNFPASQSVVLQPGPNATVAGFTASLVSTQLLAENPDRKLCHFYLSASSDETSLACWVLMGTGTASPTNFSFMMFPDDSYEIPERALTLPFQAAFNVTTGSARLQVSEVT